jgi:hypothetical protein
MTEPSQLARLVRPFPSALVHENPGGQGRGSYVSHDVVTQKLLYVLGGYSTHVVEVLRGDTKNGDHKNVVVGVLLSLSCTLDGQPVTITEVGDCENPGNWPHDGARMKDAMSDAIKRCAMRLGVGLHLWAGSEFFLHKLLEPEGEK